MSCTYTDNQIVDQWLECQPSPLTRSCYARDISRLRSPTAKPLSQIVNSYVSNFATLSVNVVPEPSDIIPCTIGLDVLLTLYARRGGSARCSSSPKPPSS